MEVITINERIKKIRKSLNLTLEAFGARVGVTRAAISNIESGRSNPSDQLILAICKEFRVNERWIRTGEGEMATPVTRAQEITAYADTLLSDSPDSLRSIVISYLMKWDVEDWEAVAKILKKHGLPQIKDAEEPDP